MDATLDIEGLILHLNSQADPILWDAASALATLSVRLEHALAAANAADEEIKDLVAIGARPTEERTEE